jgi:hypothetical protein
LTLVGEMRKEILQKLGREDTIVEEPAKEADEIREDTHTQITPQPQMPFPGNRMANMPQMDISQVDDSQIDMMKGMMQSDSGKEMMKNMMKAQYGMEISDQQFEMMGGMMNKDMLKSAQQTMQRNPNMMNTQRQQNAPNTLIQPSNAEQMPPQINPTEGNDMEKMMHDMQGGKQPNMDSLMENKDMIKMVFNMLKTNPAMIRSVTAGMGQGNPVSNFVQNRSDEDLKKMAVWLERLMKCFMFCYPAFKIIRDNFRALMLFFILYLIYRYLL